MTATKPDAARFAETGLSKRQVREREAAGKVNEVPDGPSRTVREIVRANVVTRFNILISALLVVILLVAPIQDALFAGVMIINTLIGIYQELKAKRTLDHLALLAAPRAQIIRDGKTKEVDVRALVLQDVLEVGPGDQIVVDGQVLTSNNFEVDESLLTGESDAVTKEPGDQVLSGSFVSAGGGRYMATRVGKDAYAVKLAEEAKKFGLVRSELRTGIDFILKTVSWLVIPTVILLVWSQLNAEASLKRALQGAVAGTVAMVPQGLVLVTSVAFAVGVIRLGRRSVLVQELPALEGLARVDVICLDKTGTLTQGKLSVEEVVPAGGGDFSEALGALAASDPHPNATLAAIGAAYPNPADWSLVRAIPFSSARKWSGASFERHGTWVLGAPEVILVGTDSEASHKAELLAVRGTRIVLLARTADPLDTELLPGGLQPVAFVLLADQIKPEAPEIIKFFESQNVAIKVISGDHPQTVGKIAELTGVPASGAPVDARDLPTDQVALAEIMEKRSVFGRVTPHQKRDMVEALQANGHVVAMTGDGVNDVLALKSADIGIAMGSGSGASRSVAQLVLLDSSFATVPQVVAEGRRVIANIERVSNLYVTKTVYAFLLAIAIGVAGWVFPFLPRHLTLVGTLTIGWPSFFLALAPSAQRARSGFMGRVIKFSLPAGFLAAAATFAAYSLARDQIDVNLDEARTTATLVLVLVGLFVLAIISRPFNPARRTLVMSMGGVLALIFLLPATRTFFALEFPPMVVLTSAVGVAAITGALMFAALRAIDWAPLAPQLLRSRRAKEMELQVERRLLEVEDGIESGLKRIWRSVRSIFVGHDDADEGPQ
ncbi:MAG: HAD-IC family P-type ATPase [Acidimicrobiia bacterium]